MKKARRRERESERGISVVEVVIALAITAVISSVVLVNHGRTKGNILTTNLAYDVALSIREVQQYGIAVRDASNGSIAAGQFGYGYGLSMTDTTHDSPPTPVTQLYLFIDRDQNNLNGGGSESLRTMTFGQGAKVERFCGKRLNGLQICNTDDPPNKLDSLHISFDRPEPDATIKAVINSSTETLTEATISLASRSGQDTSGVTVTNTGQISVVE